MIFALLLLYGVRTLHLVPVTLGALISASSVGAIVAAATGARLIQMLGLGRAMALSIAADGALTLLIPLATPGDAALMLAMALVGASFCSVVYNIGQVTLRQSITPPRQLGRMNASMRFLVWGPIPLGAAFAGLLAVNLGLRSAIWAGALISLAAVIPVLRAPLRTLDSIPLGADCTTM
jgi:predicted MFS family arabinose efflux permease